MSHPATGQQPTPQPTPAIRYLKLTLAVISVAIGGLMLLVSVFTLDFPMMLIALAIGIPGAWWFLHERKAKAGVPMKRHWGVVAAVAVASFVIGGALTPEADPADEAVAAAETTSAAPTSTTSTPRPTSTTSKATTTSATATSTTTEPEPVEEPAPVRRDPAPQRAVAPAPTPAPAPAYTPPPAPAPAPAPAPVPESPGAVTGRTVTPGAFCKDVETGMTGQTSTGLTVTCTKAPGEDRSRWRA